MKKTIITAVSLILSALFLLSSCEKTPDVTDTTAETTAPAETTADETDTETEEDETTAEPLPPPYDNTHAYIFADSDKQTTWSVSGAETAEMFGVLKMTPTNHDPMIYCTFVESERFDAKEYPFVAYRYNIKSRINVGVFFVASEDHPEFSDSGLTWVNLNNKGEWVNSVTDMRKNPFWEGKIKAFRIDPVNDGNMDKNAVIYLDRVGFFKTEKDAKEFLEAASDPDLSKSVRVSDGFAGAYIPGNTLGLSDDVNAYLPKETGKAETKNGIQPLAALKLNGETKIIPVSYVNSVGYLSYMAEVPGEYTLFYPGKATAADEDFVTVRGIMSEDDIKTPAVTVNQVKGFLSNTFAAPREGFFDGSGIADGEKTASGEDIAVLISDYLKMLDMIPYTDPDLKVKGKSKTDIAVCSGIVSDISAQSVSGKETASILTRMIKAMLNQPVLPSNIPDKDRILIGAWSHFSWKINDEELKKFADAGLNFMVTIGDIEQDETLRTVLNGCRKYGIPVVRMNYSPWKFKAKKPDQIPPSCFAYFDYDSYLGNYIFDEPGTTHYDMMSDLTAYYNENMPGKLCYYNLLPMYANAAQLKYGASAANIDYYDSDPDLYKNYVEEYAKKIPGDYICVDIYPNNSSGKIKKTYKDYLKNMDIVADVCRRYDRDFWLYIQTMSIDGGPRTPDYNDIRWQLYNGLSFGVKTFIHFVYGTYSNTAMVVDGEPTEVYYAAQKANKEILALSDDYVRYKNVGAFNKNCEKAKYAYAHFDNQYTGFTVLKDIESSDPLLFGCFEEKNGDGYAFTVVNMNDLNKPKSASVSFKTDGDHTLFAWIRGEKVELKPEGGVYSLELEPAEGVFITVD